MDALESQTVYLVRHGARLDYEMGKDEYNRSCGGVMSHDPPLSTYGACQAVKTANRLRALAEGGRVDRLLVSPFLRCIETAAPIADSLQLRMCIEEGLWEVGQTDLELPSVLSRDCSTIDIEYKSTFRPSPTERFPEDCLSRCAHFVGSVLDGRFSNENIIIVSHAATVVGLVGAILQCPIADVAPAAPAGIYRLTRRRGVDGYGNWEADLLSDAAHLDDPDADGSYQGTFPWPIPGKSSSASFIAAGADPSVWTTIAYAI